VEEVLGPAASKAVVGVVGVVGAVGARPMGHQGVAVAATSLGEAAEVVVAERARWRERRKAAMVAQEWDRQGLGETRRQ
jgi:hypothetical protein